MKYYCIGKGIGVVKVEYSNNFFANLPIIGVPIFGKLPITEKKMEEAFANSENLILCKTLKDANAMRHAKIATVNVTSDYPIFEIEVSNNSMVNLSKLRETTKLSGLVSDDLHFKAEHLNDKSGIPDIEICSLKKSDLNPKLIACHYLSPIDEHEVKPKRSVFNLQ